MSDRDELVKQLRGWDHCWPAPWLETAVADAAAQIERDGREIERLTAENERLREALESCPPTSNPTVTADYHLERINAWWKNIARAALNGEGET